RNVTGVQTCALPISPGANTDIDRSAEGAAGTEGSWLDFLTGLVPSNFLGLSASAGDDGSVSLSFNALQILVISIAVGIAVLKVRSEERRVGEEWRWG